ncbi:MAG: hypothetical protein HY237_14205 [Acidobacteria bacterium]|nr:hypothetical protein [Acidobacteriota bacterium]
MKARFTCAAVFLIAALVSHAQTPQKVEDPATKKKVQTAVEQYIKQEAELKGGFFLRDAKDTSVRDLKFDHVHQGLEQTGAGQYAVCVDFLDKRKNRLDVDFWLKPTAARDLQISKIRIHKVNGVERKAEPGSSGSKNQ